MNKERKTGPIYKSTEPNKSRKMFAFNFTWEKKLIPLSNSMKSMRMTTKEMSFRVDFP